MNTTYKSHILLPDSSRDAINDNTRHVLIIVWNNKVRCYCSS